ncbi:MAG: hypothetical protein JRI36_13535 [Deltaproteobacteria bacterium]|nr:hypothetical protein [Deltaproteobacteria bacterium]
MWYKYDRLHGWQADALKVVSVISDDRKSVRLYLEDGGAGDADGIANGVIVDPGGIGLSYTPQPASDESGGSAGGGGGCFVSILQGSLPD